MEQTQLTWIANFIWGIADDVLRDVYVRGKYRDVILPMTVIRRLDAVLEPTKQAVLAMKARLDQAGITNQDEPLRQAAGQAFYNASPFTLRDLRARARQQQLKAEGQVDENAPPVIKKIHKPGKAEADPLRGLFEVAIAGKPCAVEYEPDTELRDTEQVPLLEEGGIEAFFTSGALPAAVCSACASSTRPSGMMRKSRHCCDNCRGRTTS